MKKETAHRIRKGLLIFLLVFLFLVLGMYLLMVMSGQHRSDPSDIRQYETSNPYIGEMPAVSGHRSGGGIMPEETMMAFRYCAENPEFHIDIFEFDLHITKDDVLVLLHDDTLDRTSDCEAVFGETEIRPENYTYEELRLLNMGAKFVHETTGETPYADLHGEDVPDDLRILRVEDVLSYLEDAGQGRYRYIIEIKNGGESGLHGVDLLYSILEERDLLDRVIFGTFHRELSLYVDETYPAMTRSASIHEVMEFYFSALFNFPFYDPPCHVLQVPFIEDYLKYGINLGTAQVINYAHKHDMALQYWTINNPEDMEYLCSVGADCIMSDYPDRLWDVMEASGLTK